MLEDKQQDERDEVGRAQEREQRDDERCPRPIDSQDDRHLAGTRVILSVTRRVRVLQLDPTALW
jgi:hypothetical protein